MWLTQKVKLRASVGRGFRLPTYTDLYYHDPANVGNPLLKAESSWTLAAGPEFNPGARISGTVTLFFRRDRNGIDYVKLSEAKPWQATNVQDVAFRGAETALHFQLRRAHLIDVRYTQMIANRRDSSLISRYVYNYPAHNAVVSWSGTLPCCVAFRTRFGVVERYGKGPYSLWDLGMARDRGVLRPYFQLSNVTNTQYQEIQGVDMPGRSLQVGIELSMRSTGHRH
jgi:iron complex outermembrane receptor protein